MSLPIFSRLSWEDYNRLAMAATVLLMEGLLRFISWLLPISIIDFCRFHLLKIGPRLFRGFHDEDIQELKDDLLGKARTTMDLIAYHGYGCEEHVVITSDGYCLVMHRILPKPPMDGKQVEEIIIENNSDDGFPSPPPSVVSKTMSTQSTTSKRRAVFMMHGAMMSSEIWVCQRSAGKNFALKLVDAGYDVWLGNRRGNKYSQKHITMKPHEARFWDFSLDEAIMHDIPAMVEHILLSAGVKRISVISFSQGAAECLAAISLNRRLGQRVNAIVGLSTAARPPTNYNTLVSSMSRWPAEILFLVFGRRSMLKSVYFWQRLLSPRAMGWIMDWSMWMLFGWRNKNIRGKDKFHLYEFLYSEASVKQIAHWMQIMKAKRFQMYDDGGGEYNRVIPEYPLGNITIPIALFLGGADCLVDLDFMRKKLKGAIIHVVSGYEHIDTIWAHSAESRIFEPAIEFLHSTRTTFKANFT